MNKKALGLAGLGAVALVGGSLAYYSHEATLDNPFTTGHNSTELYEDYTPPTDDMKPGAKWDKEVGATNTGDYPVLVRIEMNEKWTRKGTDTAYKTLDGENAKFINNGKYENDVFEATQEDVDDKDGLEGHEDGQIADAEGTVVYKHLNATDDQTAPAWYYNADDGYWYWNRVLMPNDDNAGGADETDLLMDYLVLANNIDLGKYDKAEKYQCVVKKDDGTWPEADPNGWLDVVKETPEEAGAIPYYTVSTKADSIKVVDKKDANAPEGAVEGNKDGQLDMIDIAIALELEDNEKILWQSKSDLDPNNTGYADSNYTLSIKASFVQATTEAVSSEWGLDEQGLNKLFGTNTAPGTLEKIERNYDADGNIIDTTLKNVD